jgi:HPt (histidine-containing phosphotransfer) domain-containing protein
MTGGSALATAAQAHDWPSLAREAHTLRGLCATIGANDMARLCAELERAVKQESAERTQSLVDALKEAAEALLLVLIPQLQVGLPPLVTPHADVDADAIQAQTEALERLVHDSDSAAISLWRQQRAVFMTAFDPVVFSRLDTAIESCDFDAALALLQERLDDVTP